MQTVSPASSQTHVPLDTYQINTRVPEVESTTPENKLEELEKDSKDDDWEHNPANPRNWPPPKKWVSVGIVAFYTFVTPLGSAMMAPGLPDLAEKYNITNPTVVAMTLCIFLLSFAIGPLIVAPLSEMYGRAWILHIGNLVFIAFNLGCALAPTTGAFIAFRFIAGFAGSAPIAMGGGCISDLFSEHDRASAMALYSLGPLLGPAIGPIAGGFIAQSIGIQYVFYIIVGVAGIASVVGIPFFRETYAPIIRRRLMQNDLEKASRAPVPVAQNDGKLRYLWINLSRPVVLLTQSPICFMLSLYMALIYGIYYLMFATFSDLFAKDYGFNVGVSGLAYIGLGFGFLTATLFGAKISDKIYLHLSMKNGGIGKPEMRIPSLIFGSFFVPIGLFWYGWSAQAKIHWIMPIIGTGIFGFGLMTSYLPISLYLVDTFTYAASAMSAASVFRSLLGFAFPLFGTQMYKALGYGGGNSLLAGLAIVIGIPFPMWLYYAGERLRARSSLSRSS